ncbi:MAG: hypothetical protein GKR92_05020 [Gammaproteobacteria bacterium]|nr:MAG: hypothetical protein GKR92_05020 [Gammaproteobacteria bacterium]
MSYKTVVLVIHGMGDTPRNYAEKLEKKLSKKVGSAWPSVYFDSIYYADIFQKHQKDIFTRIKATDDIDWIALRKFLLYGFSDAAGLERRASQAGSPYEQVQDRILDALDKAYDAAGPNVKIVLMAHSLGCHVISNYIWDVQSKQTQLGAWREGGFDDSPVGSDLDKFRRLKNLKLLCFTGCNIPIFLAGIPHGKIKAISSSSKGYSFKWKNFYDPDDPLGWPLKNISTRNIKESFKYEVNEDNAVNVGNLLNNWNPLSHNNYWSDNDVINPIADDIKRLIG